MRRCAVCGIESSDVREYRTVSGTRYGEACTADAGLLWEAHFIKATGGSTYDAALVQWEWRRRRAEVEGRIFLEPPPKSPAEKSSERWAAQLGAES